MRILAVDSSATSASCGVFEDGKRLSEFTLNIGLTHSQTLMPMIDAALKTAFIDISSIDLFAVSNGPGSFTGVRIGVAAIKGIAMAQNKPCIGVSTLEAMAYNHQQDCVVCAVMDARRNQFYNALFSIKNNTVTRLCDDRAISAEDLSNELNELDSTIILVGDGAQLCYNLIGAQDKDNIILSNENTRYQCAYGVAMAALAHSDKDAVSHEQLVPVYLRPSQAERELSLKKNR